MVRAVGRPAEAKSEYERAIALMEPQVQQNPTDTSRRFVLACAIRRRGLALGDLGDPAGAAADARRALGLFDGLPPRSVEELFETACCHAALAGLAGRPGRACRARRGKPRPIRRSTSSAGRLAWASATCAAFRDRGGPGPAPRPRGLSAHDDGSRDAGRAILEGRPYPPLMAFCPASHPHR